MQSLYGFCLILLAQTAESASTVESHHCCVPNQLYCTKSCCMSKVGISRNHSKQSKEEEETIPMPKPQKCDWAAYASGKCTYDEYKRFQAEKKKKIKQIICGLQSGGDFCSTGSATMPVPGLVIDGVGEIALPLLPYQAQAIKTVATQAPFGKGTDTIVDVSVRNTLQIDSSKVSFTNPEWEQALSDLMNTACIGLGIDISEFEPVLYKILLYEQGGHFKPHKDSEKEDGMFGTFVLQFPSAHTGGEFVVRHCDIERELPLGSDDSSCGYKYHYLAHYADCVHEVREIKDGIRLVAVYSLCWRGDGAAPSAPQVAPLLHFADAMADIDCSLAVMLKHEYSHHTLNKLGFRALKGVDRVIAGTLMAANKVMVNRNADDELIFYIVQATRIYPQSKEGRDHPGHSYNPRIEEKYYGVDGYATGNHYRGFGFSEGVMNHDFEEDDFQKIFEDDDFEPIKDVWWREDGCTEDYMGNEGSERKYECFVLVFYRTSKKELSGPL